MLHFVFDIDGTLFCGEKMRPGTKELLDFCQKNFASISIWTHASQEWMMEKIAQIHQEIECEWNYTLWSAHAQAYSFPTGHLFAIKPLQYIWDRDPIMNDENTFIIEDCDINCVCNKKNSIIVSEYFGDENDRALFDLIEILKKKL